MEPVIETLVSTLRATREDHSHAISGAVAQAIFAFSDFIEAVAAAQKAVPDADRLIEEALWDSCEALNDYTGPALERLWRDMRDRTIDPDNYAIR